MNSFEEDLYLANDDLESAKIMLENEKFSKACFFAQQAVEKFLKAFLKYHHKSPLIF